MCNLAQSHLVCAYAKCSPNCFVWMFFEGHSHKIIMVVLALSVAGWVLCRDVQNNNFISLRIWFTWIRFGINLVRFGLKKLRSDIVVIYYLCNT